MYTKVLVPYPTHLVGGHLFDGLADYAAASSPTPTSPPKVCPTWANNTSGYGGQLTGGPAYIQLVLLKRVAVENVSVVVRDQSPSVGYEQLTAARVVEDAGVGEAVVGDVPMVGVAAMETFDVEV